MAKATSGGYKGQSLDLVVAVSYIGLMKPVFYSRAAAKALRRMPLNVAQLIQSKIVQYAANPSSLANNVKTLHGRTGIRLRVGEWRVIMDDDGAVLEILEIGPRGGVYD